MSFNRRFLDLCLGTAAGAALGLAAYVACSIVSYGLGWFSRSQVEVAFTVGPNVGALLGCALGALRPEPIRAAVGAGLAAGIAHTTYLLCILGGTTNLEPSSLQLYLLKGVALSALSAGLVGWYFDALMVPLRSAASRWMPDGLVGKQ